MESRLLEIIVCPICKSPLRHDRQRQELVCRADRLAFPIRDGVPIMLEGEARELPVAASRGPTGLQNDDESQADAEQPTKRP